MADAKVEAARRPSLRALLSDRLVIGILVLGFASGLPLALTGATLRAWLKDTGVDIRTIGLFAAVATPYALKFLWSPLLDRVRLPVLGRALGHRRGWLAAIQVLLAGAILLMGQVDPALDAGRIAALAVAVAFLSASQDIVIDAFRVELLDAERLPAGAAAVQLGYRIAMLASGAGALYLATFFGWAATYAVMAALIGVGLVTVLLLPEPSVDRDAGLAEAEATLARLGARPGPMERALAWLYAAVVAPFADFARRPAWALVLAFVVLFYLGEAMAGVLATPFLLDIGFSKIDIANVQKVFGTAATMAGLPAGLWLMRRMGVMRALWIAGAAQGATTLLYVVQARAGADVAVLVATVAGENFAGGMASACFVAYLSGLCNVAYTATQYALLSSLSSVARTLLAAWVGYIQAAIGWEGFFTVCTLATVPALLILLVLARVAPIPETAPGLNGAAPEGRSPA
jgi:PAT family beta-lactamase induction signal transducer AmpG